MNDHEKYLKELYDSGMADKIYVNPDPDTGGTVLVRNLPNGKREIFGIENNQDNAGYHELQLRDLYHRPFSSPAVINEPSRNAPRSEWFDYYQQCKQKGKPITLKYLAEIFGLSESRTRHLHTQYLKQHKNDT